MFIVSKYLLTSNDFINVICINSKFKETTEKFRFNPIPINSLKLFPKLQTQYLYNKNDLKIKGVNNYEIDYEKYVIFKNNNIGCRHITYSKYNRRIYGNNIPNDINVLETNCFGNNNNINSIIIPNNVTTIRSICFSGCTKLTNIVLSNNLMTINNQYFDNCNSLTSITILSSVQFIKESSFNYCQNLQTISIPNTVTSIEGFCFWSCLSLQSIILPFLIKTLETCTFYGCLSLKSIQLPTELISIRDCCFLDCKSLTRIELPSTLKQIGSKCFTNCKFETILIPNSVKSIGIDCFKSCTTLTNLIFESKINEFTFEVSYSDSVLYNQFGIKCTNIVLMNNDINLVNSLTQQTDLSNFVIPNNVIALHDHCFSYNTYIKSITIPTTVTSIGDYCFNNRLYLTPLSIPNSLKTFGIGCFEKCDNLKKLSLPLNKRHMFPFKVTFEEYLILKKKCGIDCEMVTSYNHDYFKSKLIPNTIPYILYSTVKSNETKETTIPNNVILLKSNHLSKDITTVTIPKVLLIFVIIVLKIIQNYNQSQSQQLLNILVNI